MARRYFNTVFWDSDADGKIEVPGDLYATVNPFSIYIGAEDEILAVKFSTERAYIPTQLHVGVPETTNSALFEAGDSIRALNRIKVIRVGASPYLIGSNVRGSIENPTQTLGGDVGLTVQGRGITPAATESSMGEIRFRATQNHTTTAWGSSIDFAVAATDSIVQNIIMQVFGTRILTNVPVEIYTDTNTKLKVFNSTNDVGLNLNINNSTGVVNFTIAGGIGTRKFEFAESIDLTGNLTFVGPSRRIIISGVSVTTPAITLGLSTSNTGIDSLAANQIDLIASGAARVVINSGAVEVGPVLRAFSGAQVIVGGVTSTWSRDVSGVYIEAVGSNPIRLISNGLTGILINVAGRSLFNDGNATDPGISFQSESNTGLYRIGANNLGISVGGVLRFNITTSGMSTTVPLLLPDGVAANPGIAFNSDADTGIFRAGSNSLSLVTGGSARFNITNFAATFNVPITASVGISIAAGQVFTFNGGITSLFTLNLPDDTSTYITRTLVYGAADSAGAGYRVVRVPN